jgi:ferredoxin
MAKHADILVDRCLGYGECAIAAPDLFELGDDNLSTVIDDDEAWRDRDGARQAQAACPTGAIVLHDDEPDRL